MLPPLEQPGTKLEHFLSLIYNTFMRTDTYYIILKRHNRDGGTLLVQPYKGGINITHYLKGMIHFAPLSISSCTPAPLLWENRADVCLNNLGASTKSNPVSHGISYDLHT